MLLVASLVGPAPNTHHFHSIHYEYHSTFGAVLVKIISHPLSAKFETMRLPMPTTMMLLES
jgi:hypothetical protein